MSPTYSGTTATSDPTIGVTTAESGILITGFDYSVENDSVWFRDRWGGRIGRATNHDAALNYTFTGEVSDGSAGVNLASYTAAATIANEDFFASSGTTHHGLVFTTADTMLNGASGSAPAGAARTVTLEYIRPILYTV